MAQTFRPEFLNRIDDIVVFHPLGMAQIEKIATSSSPTSARVWPRSA